MGVTTAGASTYEKAAVGLSVGLVFVYHAWFFWLVVFREQRSVIGLNLYFRREWARRILLKKKLPPIIGVQTLRNTIVSSSFFATTSIAIAAGILSIVVNPDHNKDGFLVLKLIILAMLFVFAFFCFALSIRNYNHASFIVAVRPPKEGWHPPPHRLANLYRKLRHKTGKKKTTKSKASNNKEVSLTTFEKKEKDVDKEEEKDTGTETDMGAETETEMSRTNTAGGNTLTEELVDGVGVRKEQQAEEPTTETPTESRITTNSDSEEDGGSSSENDSSDGHHGVLEVEVELQHYMTLKKMLVWGSIYWTMGIRCVYLAVPTALWLFGPTWLLVGIFFTIGFTLFQDFVL
ncbi:hypothetical protein QOT17_013551 [Balamuthia mandrillaris]